MPDPSLENSLLDFGMLMIALLLVGLTVWANIEWRATTKGLTKAQIRQLRAELRDGDPWP
jgi:hypothetical protein